jgi:uncharacterized protein (TIGR02646 family)
MRRVFRPELSARSARLLQREQAQADTKRANGTLNVDVVWTRARRNQPLREAFNRLRQMAGNRERCMYCSDSHGTDIEHFWPKTPYPMYMFRWQNMLLCCTECGRIKGTAFPLIEDQPALIDPSVDNPWEFLDFDPITGNIIARYDADRNEFILKGRETVRVLQLDRREALASGYVRTIRRLQRKVEEALEKPDLDANQLIRELRDADDHGLLGWCFDGLGSRVSPFVELRTNHSAVWQKCLQIYHQPETVLP